MTTTASAAPEPFNWDDLEKTYQELIEATRDLPTKFVCSKSTYANLMRNAKFHGARPTADWTLFNLRVEVDPDMKPGEWKFEYRG